MPKRDEQELTAELESWARSVAMPTSPDVSRRVGSALRASRNPTPAATRWSGRWFIGMSGVGLAVVAVVALIVWLQPPSASQPLAETIMSRAAQTAPPADRLVRQTFALQESRDGRQYRQTVNVWEGTNNGYYTVVEVRRARIVSAVRFIETSSTVSRSWASDAERDPLLTALKGTPCAAADARLIADRLQSAAIGKWHMRLVRKGRIFGESTYELLISPRSSQGDAIRVDISARTYRLVAIRSGDFQARLVNERVLPLAESPNLVVTYLHSTQNPSSTGVVAQY